jgi:hypothetical protein
MSSTAIAAGESASLKAHWSQPAARTSATSGVERTPNDEAEVARSRRRHQARRRRSNEFLDHLIERCRLNRYLAVECRPYLGAAGDRRHAYGGQPLAVVRDQLGDGVQFATKIVHRVPLA